MDRNIRADYSEQYLLPPSIEDWVPPDHPARFIREYVDLLDLEALGFKLHESLDGRPAYSCDLLLKAWLYGYFDRIRSARRLEKACRENIALVWLTGNHAPDHNTLWRFFKDNRRALRCLFKQGVRMAMDAKLIGMVLHAVDGTKIKARVSKDGVLSRDGAKELLAALDASVDRMMDTATQHEKEPFDYRIPRELTDREALRERLEQTLSEMEKVDRKLLAPDEPEARMMQVSGKVEPGYNAQVVVDKESGMIVAEEVVNEECDKHMLNSMIDEVEENVGKAADETLADAGYCSSEELSIAEERNHSVLINVSSENEGEFHWTKFCYDEKDDCVICPLGKRLEFSHVDHSQKLPRRVYICKCQKECPRRWDCSKTKRTGRRIRLLQNQAALLRNRLRMREPAAKELMRQRKIIVEPVFGVLKECMGFRRWTVAGLKNVRAQWAILCTAFNLSKLYKQWLEGRLVLKAC